LDAAELDAAPSLGYVFARGAFCIVFEAVEFGSLRDLLVSRRLEGVEVRDLIFAVSQGLHQAHSNIPPIVHRDLKPENILLPEGSCRRAKVADFGIARMEGGTKWTSTGYGVGTGLYMPPEQFRGSSEVGPSADLYSLALVVAECLTAEVPYDRNDDILTFQARSEGEPIPDMQVEGTPRPAISAVIRQALSPQPERRQGDALFLATAMVKAGVEDGLWPSQESEAIAVLPGLDQGEFWVLSDQHAERSLRNLFGQGYEYVYVPQGNILTNGAPAWRLLRGTALRHSEPTQPRRGRKSKSKPPTAKGHPTRRSTSTERRRVRSSSAAFMKPMTPSPALAEIVGSKPLPRVEVTKRLWGYIKRHGLQDARNRRAINADRKLLPIFGGKKQVTMFDMTKLVNRHLR
jgi:serine/threonine protein kinase